MRHLYIIGNGFDIFTGLKTKYSNFRRWLQCNYAFIYEALVEAYGILEGEWWNDFEMQLGRINVDEYVQKFQPKQSVEEIIAEIEKRRKEEPTGDGLPSPYNAPCANRLKGLLDVLQYCFERWVESQETCYTNPQYVKIETEDSFFINFNYTDVLERLYEITDEKILHIHGRAAKHDRLIFGHNRPFRTNHHSGHDGDKVDEVLARYEKNPYQYLFEQKNQQTLNDALSNTEFVHIYGLSFSPVDEDYLDWIYEKTNPKLWEISQYSEEDMRRVNLFILHHPKLIDRVKLIRLEELKR